MRDIEHAVFWLLYCDWLTLYAEQTLRFLILKHVIQASTASSHRVGKCIIEPSKQSRIRKSSFWSHRRSTVQWETALSSKERSRRVNCPMLVPYYIHNNLNYASVTIYDTHFNYNYHIKINLVTLRILIVDESNYLLRQWQAVTVEYNNDECLALPLPSG